MIGKKRFLLYLMKKSGKRTGRPQKTVELVETIRHEPTKHESSDGHPTKKFHLTVQQAEERIEQLKIKLPELEGVDQRSKRKRVYHELSQLQKAIAEPQTYLLDPVKEERRKKDSERRIAKKIKRKEELLKQIRRDKKKHSDKVCLLCKQLGHIAADCRENPTSVAGVVCYSCGSHEHSVKECPEKSGELKFALCFVCKKTGHISRECPENKNGIYFKGGSCFICGGVDHLKQDCPKNPINKIRNKRKNVQSQQFFEEYD